MGKLPTLLLLHGTQPNDDAPGARDWAGFVEAGWVAAGFP